MVQALAQPDLVPLSQLENDLGISRVDLLLLLRRLGIQPIRRGMRTLLSADQAGLSPELRSQPLDLEVVQLKASRVNFELTAL